MDGDGLHLGVGDARTAVRGWLALQRARIAHHRHPDLGEISAFCFYATRLRFRDLAFDIGANRGAHTGHMLYRGATVVALEPQAKLAAQLTARFPAATVLGMAVSDEPGLAVLHRFRESDQWASLNADWGDYFGAAATPDADEEVPVTTLDLLIDKYGEPALVKIDTEGFDHRALRGLSRPLDQILFEVHAAARDDAAQAFDLLEALGDYEYKASPSESWLFGDSQRPEQILAKLPDWGSVYARHIAPSPCGERREHNAAARFQTHNDDAQ